MYIAKVKTEYQTLHLLLEKKNSLSGIVLDKKMNLIGNLSMVAPHGIKNYRKLTADRALKIIVGSKDENLRDLLKDYLKKIL